MISSDSTVLTAFVKCTASNATGTVDCLSLGLEFCKDFKCGVVQVELAEHDTAASAIDLLLIM
jgi:hypothetical protein